MSIRYDVYLSIVSIRNCTQKNEDGYALVVHESQCASHKSLPIPSKPPDVLKRVYRYER